jgi:hypothetical protein
MLILVNGYDLSGLIQKSLPTNFVEIPNGIAPTTTVLRWVAPSSQRANAQHSCSYRALPL